MERTGYIPPAEQLPAVRYDVPFVDNTGDRCLVANIASVLHYFMPGHGLQGDTLDAFCGYVRGMGAWKTQSMLSLAQRGFDVRWIENDDLGGFAADPYSYMKKAFPDPVAYEDQLAHSNLRLEAERVAQYLQNGLPFEQRVATEDDIKSLLAEGFLVRISVNASLISDAPHHTLEYDPHSVLLVGYAPGGVILHNAHRERSIPFQPVGWQQLMASWNGYGVTRALNAYRR